MAHNPILKQQAVGRMEGFKVELNTIGLLYQGQRFVRPLEPGDGPSMKERLASGNMQIYVVDAAPHTLAWRVSLPAKGDKDFFASTIHLKYHVSDPQRMITDRVTDTETTLTRVLEPQLRRESRKYALNKHIEVDTVLEDTIQSFDLPGKCGLRLIKGESPAVVIDLGVEDHQRIETLNKIERAMRVAQLAEHIEDLPSQEPAYNFHVVVNFSYKVSNPDEMPLDSPAECEKQLWPRIKRMLVNAGHKFTVTEIDEATKAMQAALDDLAKMGHESFGLKVLSADVTVDLELAARKRYVELAEEEHNNKLQEVKLRGLQAGKEFYAGLIHEGQWSVLAVAVSKDEIKMADLADKMSEQEHDKLDRQIELLKMMRDASTRDTEQEHDVVKVLVNSVAGQVVGTSANALPAQAPKPQLPDSQKAGEQAKDKPQ